MGRDHPVFAHNALENVQLALLVLVRRVGGDMEVAAIVVEARLLIRSGEATAGVIA